MPVFDLTAINWVRMPLVIIPLGLTHRWFPKTYLQCNKLTPEGGPIDIDTGDVSAGQLYWVAVSGTYMPPTTRLRHNNYYYLYAVFDLTADQLGTHAAGFIPLGLTHRICSSKTYLCFKRIHQKVGQ